MRGGLILTADTSPETARLAERSRRSLLAVDPALSVWRGGLSEAAQRAATCPGGLFLLKAGAWFPEPETVFPPPPSATGKPVVAFGLNRHRAPSWREILRRAGGDLTGEAAALFTEEPPPALALDPAASAALARGETWETLLAGARVARLPWLDVCEDDGLRVAQVITSLQRGGAERMALDLHRELNAQGVAARLIVTGKPGRQAFDTPDDAADLSEVPALPEPRARAIAGEAVKFGADLLHAHLLKGAELKALKPYGIPVLATLHNTARGWPADLTTLDRDDVRLLAACSLTVAADARERLPGIPARVAWNGVDLAAFRRTPAREAAGAKLREALLSSKDGLLILTLANPRPQKRFDRLPAVLAALRQLRPEREIRLLIAGEAARDAEAERCVHETRRLAEERGVAESVLWHGPAEDVPALLCAADALLSVSAHEGLSLAHLEALAMSVPVVALEAGGTAEIARAAGGAMIVLPQAATPEEIARAVLTAKPSDTADEEIRRRFSVAAMARRYHALYHRALNAPPGPGETIWLITNNFTTGGAQSSARRLLTHWKNQGIPVRAAVLQEEPDAPTAGRLALEGAGVPVLVLPRLGPCDAAETVAALWPELDADPPRAVLFWNAVVSAKRLIADGLPRTPVFDVSPGGMCFEALRPSFEKPRADLPALTARDYGANLTGVVVKFTREAARAEAELGAPVRVIPNGVPLPDRPVPFRENPRPFVFGTAARLHPQKRLEDLLDAFRLALPRLPDCELRIAGGPDGDAFEYAAELRKRANGLPVAWPGNVSDISGFHRELDAFVMISEPDGCPNASLEALAAGLAVVATDFGGASEQVVDGETGLLVPPRDPEALAEAMIRVARDGAPRRRCAERARLHVAERFSVERMADAYLAMIQEAAGAAAPGSAGGGA